MDPTSSHEGAEEKEEREEVNNGQNNSDSVVLKASMNGENEVEVNGKETEDEDDEQPPPLQDITSDGDGKNVTSDGDGMNVTSDGDGKKKSGKKHSLNKEKVADEDGWIDILENGQLLKKVLKEGDDESRPQRSCKVIVSLRTRIKESGQEVASETFEHFTAFIGDYDLIHGVDLALPLMNVGEVAQVIIHPRFGYGDQGKKPDIPPNASLHCEIHLHSSQWIDSESQLSLEERIKFGS